jgi:hypothetical protein
MSEYNEWDDDDTDTDGDGRGGKDNSTGMKELRKANAALKKQLSELQESYSLVTKTQRDRSVKDVLKSKGLPDKVSALIPADVTSEEDVDAWITEYGDVFGITANPEANAEGENEVRQDFASLNRISQAQAGGTTYSGGSDQLDSLVRNAGSPEELNKILFGTSQAPEAY